MVRYDLTISVTNKDTTPQLSSSTVVQVYVLDLNDKAPEFTSSSYNRTLSESAATGTKIVTVTAVDKDEVLGMYHNYLEYYLFPLKLLGM